MKNNGRPTRTDKQNALASAITGTGELRDPPGHFSADARAIWKQVVDILPPGVLQRADGFVVETLVDAIVLYRRARATIERDGEMIDTVKGPIRHPAAVSLQQHRQAIAGCCNSLGMSPQGRAKIGLVAEHEHPDPLDQYID